MFANGSGTALEDGGALSAVAFSGSYLDLTNKPTIPAAMTQGSLVTLLGLSGDCSLTSGGVLTCTKSNGTVFGTGAFAPAYTLPTASTSVLGGVKVDGSTITVSGGVISSPGLGFTSENVANKSTDGTMAANSDTLYPSQKAVVTYVGAHGGGGGGAVSSVFGRTGAVVAASGDYSLSLLADVVVNTPTLNQFLIYNGTKWINSAFPSAVQLVWANISSAVKANPPNVPTSTIADNSPTSFPTGQTVNQFSYGYHNWSTSLRANKTAVANVIGATGGGGGTTNTIWNNGYGPILTDSNGNQWLVGISTLGALTTTAYSFSSFVDNFVGSAGNISSSYWTLLTGNSMPQLTGSGSVKGNGTSESDAIYTQLTVPANQWAEMDGISYTGGYVNGVVGVAVRASTANFNGYYGFILGNGSGVVTANVERYNSGAGTYIYTGPTISPSNKYTKIKLDVQGTGTSTTLTFTGWNGSSWDTFYTGTDTSGSAVNSGQPGIRLLNAGSTTWTAGPFSVGTP